MKLLNFYNLFFIIRMSPRTKIGTIVWTRMVKAWHAAFTIAKMTNRVRLTALDNLKWKLVIVLARLVCVEVSIGDTKVFQANCKGGCPCDSYECDDITTTPVSTTTIATTTTTSAETPKEAVLLLSTYRSSNVPMVIDFVGRKLTINE